VLVDVHPTGGEYLSMTHGRHAVSTYPWRNERSRDRVRDDRPLGELASSEARPGDLWDRGAGHLTDDLIIAGAVDSGRQPRLPLG
jgi:hypothetical protein